MLPKKYFVCIFYLYILVLAYILGLFYYCSACKSLKALVILKHLFSQVIRKLKLVQYQAYSSKDTTFDVYIIFLKYGIYRLFVDYIKIKALTK